MTATADLPYSPGPNGAAYGGRLYVIGIRLCRWHSSALGAFRYTFHDDRRYRDGRLDIHHRYVQSIMGGVALAFNGQLFTLGGIESFLETLWVGAFGSNWI